MTDGNKEVTTAEGVLARKLAEMDAAPAEGGEPVDELAVKREAATTEKVASEGMASLGEAEMMALVSEAEREAGEQLVLMACDMFNAMLVADPDWVRMLVSASLPVSDKIIEAAKAGDVKLELTPTPHGEVVTGVLGMVNALLLTAGCKNKVAAEVRINAKTNQADAVHRFAPWSKIEEDEE